MSGLDPRAPRLGRYVLHHRIASGGLAEVLLAEAPASAGGARRVAIKRLLPHKADDEDALNMLVNEAKVTSALDHPNIVKVLELATDPATHKPFLVMELIEGLDLHQLMARLHERGQRIAPGLAAGIMLQVLDALTYVHELRDASGAPMSVVHRDLSPSNVMVTPDGVAKLIDFGVVQAQNIDGNTRTGQIKGNLGYMAPEQMGGRSIDGRADLFAVGVTLYELITGVNPFRRSTDLATINALLDEQPAPMHRWARDCSPELEAVVRGALAKHRDGRTRSAEVMREALAAVPGWAQRAEIAGVVRSLTVDASARTVFEPREDHTLSELPRRPVSEAPTLLPGALDTRETFEDGAPLAPFDGSFEDETMAAGPRLVEDRTTLPDHADAGDLALTLPENTLRAPSPRLVVATMPRAPAREVMREPPPSAPRATTPTRPPELDSAARHTRAAAIALGLSIVFTIVALLMVLRSRSMEPRNAEPPATHTSTAP